MPLKIGENRTFFYIIMLVVAYLSYLVLRSYFSAIVLAFIAAMIFRPVYAFLQRKFLRKDKLAALLSVIFVFLVVFIPTVFVGGLTVKQIIQFRDDFAGSGSNLKIEHLVDRINTISASIPGEHKQLTVAGAYEQINSGAQALGNFFLQRLPDIGSGIFDAFTWLIIFLILLYTLFPLHHKLFRYFENISPLDDSIDLVYATRVVEMSKSMIKGTLVVALVQGTVAGIFLAIAGVPYVMFWSLLMVFLGVIPMVGYGFVMVPIVVVLIASGSVWQGVMLLLVSVLFIGNIDNYLRPKLVSKKAELHPALVILGVIGGLQVFGLLGLIYGPVIMILLVTTVEMYQKYFRRTSTPDGAA